MFNLVYGTLANCKREHVLVGYDFLITDEKWRYDFGVVVVDFICRGKLHGGTVDQLRFDIQALQDF